LLRSERTYVGFPVWETILCGDVVQPLITTAIMKFFLNCWLPG